MACPINSGKGNKYYPFFEMLSTPLRIEIIKLLQDKKSLTVTQICEALHQEQSKISHNLKRMAMCNVLSVNPKKNFRFYSLNKDSIVPILKIIDKHVNIYCKTCNLK
jgi:DNA-binding transcriptional ArsR family regulator